MELRNDQTRRYQARSAQPGPERVKAEMASAKEAQEAQLRSTIERVGEASRDEAARLRSVAGGQEDTVQFSRLAQQVAENDAIEAERRDRIAELRRAHEAGLLNGPERIERAATRMLGG